MLHRQQLAQKCEGKLNIFREWFEWSLLSTMTMLVSNTPETVRAVPRHKEHDSSSLDGSVSPAIVVYASCPVDIVDVVAVLRGPPDVDVWELEVITEDFASRPIDLETNGSLSLVGIYGGPQSSGTRLSFVENFMIAILDPPVSHQSENVITDRSYDVRVIIQAPEILQSDEDRLFVD